MTRPPTEGRESTWTGTPPSDDGGSRITGYRIQSADSDQGPWTTLERDTDNTRTSYTHSDLDPGTRQYYRVAAINRDGVGPWSDPANATTEVGVPSKPRNLDATADGRTRIDLDWDTPSDDGGARIIGYRIDVSTTGGALWTVLIPNSGSISTAYTHIDLPPGSRRTYRVAAINSQGLGRFSNTATASTRATVPDAPTNLTATASGQAQINLSWRAPLMDGGARLTGYRVEWSATGGTPWNVLTSRHTSTTYVHRSLSPATTRHYRVSAVNSVGTGEASNVATRPPRTPPCRVLPSGSLPGRTGRIRST